MLKANFPLFFLLVGTITLSACNKDENTTASHDSSSVIATVNGTSISQQQLELMKARLFSRQQPKTNMDKVILESLVASRAMSLAMLNEMNAVQKSELDTKVAAYREELLIKRYMQANITPQPVTSEMVKQYYESHQEEFSSGVVKNFEYITTLKKPTKEKRKEILTLYKKAATTKSWEKLVKSNPGLSLSYKSASSNIAVLKEPLKRLVVNTKTGKVSPVYVLDNLIIVRVTSEKLLEPQALTQVSAKIRKKLAPIKLRDAIKAAKEKVLAVSAVEYINDKK